ncbi:hypothetical protein ACX9NE_05340 [Mycobacterium sp. ML4]
MAVKAAFAIMLVAVFVVTGCSGSDGKPPRQTPTGHDNPSRLPPIYPGTTVSIPPSASAASPTSSTATSSAAPARTIPGDGTFRTGADLVPGTYRSPGGGSCYWERLRGFGGQTADIIANGAGILPQTVTIAPTDAGFRSQGCAPWTLVTDAATTTTSVALPAGAQACPPTSGPAGGFAHSAVGSADTSCPFAEQVRLAYGAGGPASVTPREVEADSPVTGQHYTMTCAANGSMVVCNGGNGAVVYVY